MASHVPEHFDSLDRAKSPFLDNNTFGYDPYHGFDYLQFPHTDSPFAVGSVPLPPTNPSPRLTFDSLNLNNNIQEYNYSSGASFTTGSPARPYTPPEGISPPVLNHLSAGELSSDGLPPQSGRRSRASTGTAGSPPSVHSSLPAPRGQHRFNPIATRGSTRDRKRRATKEEYGSDEEDEEFQPTIPASSDASRREEIRRQRIESEQRRRDELREGYRRLKDVLPVSNQKSSKVSLLDRATTHVKYLEMTQQQLQQRLNQAECETQRLRALNEALMLSTAEHRHSAVVAAQHQQQAAAVAAASAF